VGKLPHAFSLIRCARILICGESGFKFQWFAFKRPTGRPHSDAVPVMADSLMWLSVVNGKLGYIKMSKVTKTVAHS